jgi:predicted Zn-dependent peptidase
MTALMERFETVQPTDIQRLAQALFQEEKLNLAIVGPYTQNGDRLYQAIRFWTFAFTVIHT